MIFVAILAFFNVLMIVGDKLKKVVIFVTKNLILKKTFYNLPYDLL